jgi:hypothetical protein
MVQIAERARKPEDGGRVELKKAAQMTELD